MTYQGTIHNGVVVFPHGVCLPEGATVTVQLGRQPTETESTKSEASELDPVFRMAELAEDAGIPDLSVNINHYLYGHPKIALQND
jgi:hypothetical protein